jgi:GGDEF domain-containing protein
MMGCCGMFRDMINTFKKMDRIRKRYLGFAVSIFLVFAAIMASIFAFQYDIINKIHATNTRDEIIEIKKDFLEDTVNNTVRYISEIKTLNETRFLERIKRLLIFIEEHAGTYGIRPENLDLFTGKLLTAVEQSSCNKEGMNIKITISIGATCFLASDESYDDALKRADDGLYQSKRSGKNRGTKVL